MKVKVLLRESTSLTAKLGVMVYSGVDGALGTIHPVLPRPGGGIRLGPAEALTQDHVREIGRAFLQNKPGPPILLPERVLATSPDLLVWWHPVCRRSVFFKMDDGVSSNGRRSLDAEYSGRMALHPPLVFAAHRVKGRVVLSIFALREDRRPSADTRLYFAPYMNVYGDGSMCQGTARFPERLDPTEAVMEVFETAFWDTSFTHTAMGGKHVTLFPGGLPALWRMLCETGHRFFPYWTLAAVPGLAGGSLADAIARLSKSA